jgi:hypothetical protein
MEVAGIEVELIQKDIKNIHLAVYPPDGRVRLAAPMDVNIKSGATLTVSSATLTDGSQKTQVVAAGGANVDFATAAKQDSLLGKQFPNIGIHILTGTSEATAGTYTGFLVLEDAVISAITLTDSAKVTGTNNFAGITLSAGTAPLGLELLELFLLGLLTIGGLLLKPS